MPFLLHLMRHGEPVLTGRLLGHTDCAGTPAGIGACFAQASGVAVEHIVTSDLQRAVSCAARVATLAEIAPVTDPRWRELDFGAWDGLAAAEVDGAALGRFWDDPDANPPPGGERWSALVARVSAALADLPEAPTLVVTHGGAIRAALAVLCGFEQRHLWAFDLPYAAMVTLQVWREPGMPATAQIVRLAP
jgi:alpha-ribazole phosphatase